MSASNHAVARYTFGLTVATVVLAIATIGLGIGTVFQLRLARAEYISTHRPKLKIRRISLIPPFLAAVPVNLLIEAANVGETTAIIQDIGFDVYTTGQPFNAAPRPPPMHIDPVAPGREMRMTAASRAFTPIAINAINAGVNQLRLLGIINYRDGNGILRSTSFSRIYDPGLSRFVKLEENDPEADREFED